MYDKTLGRLRVVVDADGAANPDYSFGAQISCPNGFNPSCPIQTHTVSVEELRDLRYLLDRAIAYADAFKGAK